MCYTDANTLSTSALTIAKTCKSPSKPSLCFTISIHYSISCSAPNYSLYDGLSHVHPEGSIPKIVSNGVIYVLTDVLNSSERVINSNTINICLYILILIIRFY